MGNQIASVAGATLCVGSATAQLTGGMGAATSIVPNMNAAQGDAASNVRNPIVASLTYDGVNTYGFAGQDFESIFDLYDTYCCERFGATADARLTEFRSKAYGTGNPFGTTDVIAEIFLAADERDICDDSILPAPFIVSELGAGFYDGVEAVTSFDARACLPAGDYIIRWAAELNFNTFGQIFFFGQFGEHDNGAGVADDGFQSNPDTAFGLGPCFDTIDGATGLHTGVNFILCGDADNCAGQCPDPSHCGDWDLDGDTDADDFFGFLDSFVFGDVCADLDRDGDIDADDFFEYLGRFTVPC